MYVYLYVHKESVNLLSRKTNFRRAMASQTRLCLSWPFTNQTLRHKRKNKRHCSSFSRFVSSLYTGLFKTTTTTTTHCFFFLTYWQRSSRIKYVGVFLFRPHTKKRHGINQFHDSYFRMTCPRIHHMERGGTRKNKQNFFLVFPLSNSNIFFSFRTKEKKQTQSRLFFHNVIDTTACAARRDFVAFEVLRTSSLQLNNKKFNYWNATAGTAAGKSSRTKGKPITAHAVSAYTHDTKRISDDWLGAPF